MSPGQVFINPSDVRMAVYCVYKNPSDYPGKFVVRRHFIVKDCPKAFPEAVPLVVADNLTDARDVVPDWAVLVPRPEGEDPAILEVWV